MGYEKEGISQVEYEELKDILEKKEQSPLVIDVREVEEYVGGHIPGVPLIPMGDVIDLVDDFDPREEYIFVCRSGRRSQEVAKFFKMNGIEGVCNYSGGMLAWEDSMNQGEENIVANVSDLYKKKDNE
jgi:rhodanese-related sulfurtransferase